MKNENEKKPTQRELYGELIVIAENAGRTDLVEFCQDRVAQIDKKANSSKAKSAEVQAENQAITDRLIAELATFEKPVTLTDFIKGNEYASQFSTQKIRALFKKPLADGIIVNIVDKKKSLFSVAE